MYKKIVNALAAMAIATSVNAAEMGATDEPIKLAIHEWTGQHIVTHIAGTILEEMGYEVEYVTAGMLSGATAVADGSITASLELWSNNLGDFYPGLIAEGKVEDLGEIGIQGNETWMYSAHSAEKCPGLPAWEALIECHQAFATAETFPNGRVVAYPADWGTLSADLIAGENLPFTPIPTGSEGAMVAEIKGSFDAETPLLMMFWAPHWIHASYDMKWVEVPDSVREKYGMEPPRLFKAGWPGMKDKWPAAYKFLTQYQLANSIQEPLMGAIDNDGGDLEELTKKWVDENEAYWRPMTE